MKNHSYQITQIENKLNEYNIKGEVKIKELLENQQGIIKELIKIINNILAKIRNDETSNKSEDFIPLKQKNIIMNNNLHIFALPNYNIGKINYTKNNMKENKGGIVRIRVNKSVDDKINNKKVLNQKKIIKIDITEQKHGKEYKNNINNNLPKQKNKKNFFEKYINKEKRKEKVIKNKILKSKSTSEISYKPKLQNKNLILKTNNINNTTSITNNNYYNNNYTIDEEKNDNLEGISFINDRQNSCSCDINDNQEIVKRKKKIKYREKRTKALLSENNGKNLMTVKSAKVIPIKKEFFFNYNSCFPYYFYNITNSSMDKNSEYSFNKRSKSSLTFFSGNLNNIIIKEHNRAIKSIENEIYSIPYINNGKRIIPTRLTKEFLNNSYKILNKYEHKMSKKY